MLLLLVYNMVNLFGEQREGKSVQDSKLRKTDHRNRSNKEACDTDCWKIGWSLYIWCFG